MPTHNAVGLSLRLREAVRLTEWVRPKVPDVSRVYGPMLVVKPAASADLPAPGGWLEQNADGEQIKVGSLADVAGAKEYVEASWERWCREAGRELEANTGAHYKIGQAYEYETFDPCRRAAQGRLRAHGVTVGPGKPYMLAWCLRRVQEVKARFRDHRWHLHSMRLGPQASS